MMLRIVKFTLFLLLFLAFSSTSYAQYTKVFGFCEQGNNSVTLGGLNSSNKVQRSFSACTVEVFDNGTVNDSTIYSNATGSAQSNPLTAAADGQWSFYGVPGLHYDVQFRGAGIASPFTRADWVAPPNTINAQVQCTTTTTTANIASVVASCALIKQGDVTQTTQINNAIQSMATAGGGQIFFPCGTYTFTLITVGQGVTLLSPNRRCTTLSSTVTGVDAISGTSSYFSIRHMTVSASTSACVIHLTNGVLHLDDVEIDNNSTTTPCGVWSELGVGNSITSSGDGPSRINGPSGNVAGGIGVRMGNSANGTAATACEVTNVYIAGFENDLFNDKCYGLKFDVITEDTLIAVKNNAQSDGIMHSEDVYQFKWTGGIRTFTAGLALHGSTSGATGNFNAPNSDPGTGVTGHMVMNNPVGTWVTGENILDGSNNIYAQVGAIGYSLLDNSSDAGAPYGVKLRASNRPDGFSHIKVNIGIGDNVSILDWRKDAVGELITADQSVSSGTNTLIAFNSIPRSAGTVISIPNSSVTILYYGNYLITANIVITQTANSGAQYILTVIDTNSAGAATVIGNATYYTGAGNTANFTIPYSQVHLLNPGDVITFKLQHNDNGAKSIKHGTQFNEDFTAFSITGQ